MDNATSKGNERKTVIKPDENQDEEMIANIIAVVTTEHGKMMSQLDEVLSHRWVRLGDKKLLKMMRSVLLIEHNTAIFCGEMAQHLVKVTKEVENVEMIVQKITEKTDTDLTDIKAQIEELNKNVNHPLFQNLQNFIEKMAIKEHEKEKSEKGTGFYV